MWVVSVSNSGYSAAMVFPSPYGVWVVSAKLHRTADPGGGVMMGSDRKCLPWPHDTIKRYKSKGGDPAGKTGSFGANAARARHFRVPAGTVRTKWANNG